MGSWQSDGDLDNLTEAESLNAGDKKSLPSENRSLADDVTAIAASNTVSPYEPM